MGLFGNKTRGQELDKVADRALALHSQGQTRFTVSVNLLNGGGGRASSMRLIDEAADRIRALGLEVTDVQLQEWTYTAFLQVSAPGAPSAVSAQLAPTIPTMARTPVEPPRASAAIDSADPAAIDAWLTAALRPWSSGRNRGRPFGPGHGLEQALAATGPIDASTGAFQGVAQRYAAYIIDAVRSRTIDFDDYDEALGLGEPALRALGLRGRQMDAFAEPSDAAKDVLMGLAVMDAGKLAAWSRDGEARRGAFVYHRVAFGRLTGEA